MKTMEVFTNSKYMSFDLDEKSKDSVVRGEVQGWLKSQTGPVLLVLDNAQRQLQVDSILIDCSISDNSFILVTSRRRDLVDPSDLYDMPTMKDDDALELFQWHSQGANSSGLLKNDSLKL
jgi:hypothetical protein